MLSLIKNVYLIFNIILSFEPDVEISRSRDQDKRNASLNFDIEALLFSDLLFEKVFNSEFFKKIHFNSLFLSRINENY